MAGKEGLNLTRSDAADRFASRNGARRAQIEVLLKDFGAEALRVWAKGLGLDTFVGTSGRVFPTDMKAAPLLRAWLQRLRHPAHGAPRVQFHMRSRWLAWADGGPPLPSGTAPWGAPGARSQVVARRLSWYPARPAAVRHPRRAPRRRHA